MLEKFDRKLLFKITFCIILSCIMVMGTAVGTHMFGIHLPVYIHSFSTHKNHSEITNSSNKLFTFLNRLGVNSSSKVNNLPIHSNVRVLLNAENSTHLIKNGSIKTAGKSTQLNKTSQTNMRGQQDSKEMKKEQHDMKKEQHEIKKEQITMPRPDNRKKTTHIAFLKVHKAGSTTMQNIFFRFGVKQNLNILIPKRGNYLAKKSDQMPIDSSKHYDIFACHTVYNKQLFDSLLPANSVKIGIVREPIERMISAAYYYRDIWHPPYLMRVPRANLVHNLVKYPEKYEPKFFSHTRNMMAKDFGFSDQIKQTDTQRIKKYLNELNSQFLLVLTVEKFDESLVLMKRLLHWSIFDILYLKKNNHKHAPVLLNNEEKSKFRKTSFLDFYIYEYFKNILDEKLKRMTNDFWQEVKYFRTVLTQVSKYCLASSTQPKLVIQKSTWSDTFSISASDCGWMKTNEVAFINKLRQMHHKK